MNVRRIMNNRKLSTMTIRQIERQVEFGNDFRSSCIGQYPAEHRDTVNAGQNLGELDGGT
jgi:hypothetical protein